VGGRLCAIAAVMLSLLGAPVAAQTADQAPAATTLPTVEVIGTSPLPGTGIDRDKVPSNVQTLGAPDVAKQGPAALGTSLDQHLGSVNINASGGNLQILRAYVRIANT
jgi:outer membrane receptor protein involved in Fe transport